MITANPAPPGASVTWIRTRDNLKLRVARWRCGARSVGTVAILPGRAEFIEKYFEVVRELLERNLDVVVLDWRGQGRSDRVLCDPGKCHVNDFRAYERDLEALCEQVLGPSCRKPWFALGHSMGGALLLAHARERPARFARLVLTAPMLDIHSKLLPYALSFVPNVLALLGLKTTLVPGGCREPYESAGLSGVVLTSDAGRLQRSLAVIKAAPELAVGDPTIGWVCAARRFTRQFKSAGFARGILAPVLIVTGDQDSVVDTSAARRFAAQLRAGQFVSLPGAHHDILMEGDPIRARFWEAFDAFLAGR
ncbi:alpha/beta hydrolase [Candidatus Methylocalor cossyra]|uniref:alpha/beta hydrolase n=1 Tax=Candidatus Methylocalor cossyra TaxID=3108543 RepID=UPI0032B17977